MNVICIEGGTIVVSSAEGKPISLKASELPVEYLLAHFGTKVPHVSSNFSLVIAKPAEACGPLENNVKGKAVLVRRGSCPFVVGNHRGSLRVTSSNGPRNR